MRKVFVLLIFLVTSIFIWAGDIIIKLDETKIDAIITEVSEAAVKYRRASNPNGPIFVMKVEDIATIIYANGEVEVFNGSEQSVPVTTSASSKSQQVQSSEQQSTAYDAYWAYKLEEERKALAARDMKDSLRLTQRKERKQLVQSRILFQANVEIIGMVSGVNSYGYFSEDLHRDFATRSMWGGLGIESVFGFRTANNINFFGAGFGFHGLFSEDKFANNDDRYYFFFNGWAYETHLDEGSHKKMQLWYMPIYINDRIYIPTPKEIYPYADISLGGFAILGMQRNGFASWREFSRRTGGMFFRIGAGVDWRRFNFGVGYQLLLIDSPKYSQSHEAYFKIGYRFDKYINKEKSVENSLQEVAISNANKQYVITKESEVDTNIPLTNSKSTNTFVVIIANEDYKTVATVPYALNDGRIFAKYCQRTFGIPDVNIKVYENASLNNIHLALAWLKNVCEKYEGEASVIFYYAGHGIPDASDKSACLLPVDGDGRYVSTGYKLDDLYQKLGDIPTKSAFVFLDACFSGANRDGKMLTNERAVALKVRPNEPKGNTIVFSAAQSDETALPDEEQGHGMFTYYLLKKLQETRGNVTLLDLSSYVIREVGKRSAVINKPQTPCITPSKTLGSDWQNWKLK